MEKKKRKKEKEKYHQFVINMSSAEFFQGATKVIF